MSPASSPDFQTLELAAQLQEARAALATERIYNRAIIDSLGEGLVTIDAEGKITAVNPKLTSILGFQEYQLIGKWYPSAMVAVDQYGNPIEPFDRPVTRALSQGTPVSEHTYYLRSDGNPVYVLITVAPIVIEGRPAGAIQVFRDLTNENALDLAKDEFVSLASHQLKTPATGVKAILSMLLNGDFGELTETQEKFVRKAASSNDRQLQIVEDLLNVAKVDSRSISLSPEPTDLVKLIQKAIGELATTIKKRRQTLKLETPETLVAEVDKAKLRMVIDNLLSNASKYTPPEGSIEIKLAKAGDRARIRIHDSGVGIAPHDLPRLFRKFSRIDNELSQKVGGTGLGLYVAKSIVELHRGSMAVSSEPGRGTTFEVNLPLKEIATT